MNNARSRPNTPTPARPSGRGRRVFRGRIGSGGPARRRHNRRPGNSPRRPPKGWSRPVAPGSKPGSRAGRTRLRKQWRPGPARWPCRPRPMPPRSSRCITCGPPSPSARSLRRRRANLAYRRYRHAATAAESGYVSPNVNVIYGFGFADLGQEPSSSPRPIRDGRYYMIEICDMYTNAFAYPAGGASGYKRRQVRAWSGPGWTGTLPDGVKRIDAPTRWIELQPRVNVKSEADLPARRKVLQAITLQGLSEFTGGAAPAPAGLRLRSAEDDPGSPPAICSSTIRCSSGRSSRRR